MPKVLIPLIGIFIIGYFLRVMFLSDNALLFTYDQARDALVTQEIIKGDLKVLGPPTSDGSAYHGVLYYYLVAPGYLLGGGSPITASYWLAFICSLGIFVVYYLGYYLTKKVGAGLLAALLYAVSFEATQYATWLSNPSLASVTVPSMYLFVWLWTQEKKKWAAVLSGVAFGLSIQANIFLLYHMLPIGIWLFASRSKIKRQEIVQAIAGLVIGVSTMIISEYKFGFKSFHGVLDLVSSQNGIGSQKSLGDFLILYLNQLGRVFANSIYPGNVAYGGVFVLILIILAFNSWKDKSKLSWQPFILLYLLSHIVIVSIGGSGTPHLIVGVGAAVSLIAAIYIYSWWRNGLKIAAIITLFIVLFSNVNAVLRENKNGQGIFAIQRDMVLKKQLATIDYTYQRAEGQPFSINTLTSPLFTNIVWAYLYNWYGLPKYGYLPQFHGRDQIGQPIALEPVKPETNIYFLLIEPMDGIPPQWFGMTVGEEDTKSKLVDREAFGVIEIQKRIKIIK